MKRCILLLFIAVSAPGLFAQASWSSRFAFILRNQNNKAITMDEFKASYGLINVSGDTVSNHDLMHYLTYDDETNYFILDITTIGPRFSFALTHNNQLMAIYLPFVREYNYYATDIEFRAGRFLFDFDTEGNEKIYFKSNMPHYVIEKIDWEKQRKKLKRSSYADDHTYTTIQE